MPFGIVHEVNVAVKFGIRILCNDLFNSLESTNPDKLLNIFRKDLFHLKIKTDGDGYCYEDIFESMTKKVAFGAISDKRLLQMIKKWLITHGFMNRIIYVHPRLVYEVDAFNNKHVCEEFESGSMEGQIIVDLYTLANNLKLHNFKVVKFIVTSHHESSI